MINEFAVKSVSAVLEGKASFCKFLSANDSGETGGHQSGILISVKAKQMLFTDAEMRENHILKKRASIKWNDDYTTPCTFTWYESKNEIRITGFGKGSSPLRPELTGALFVLVKNSPEDYLGYILNTDDEIQEFLDSFGMTPGETNRPVDLSYASVELKELQERRAIEEFIAGLAGEFPSSFEMSRAAQRIHYQVWDSKLPHGTLSVINPDNALLEWTDEEYKLFRAIEFSIYGETVTRGFSSMDEFITLANRVLNRRKSRAGKSLEHHLSSIFDDNKISYTAQAVTEGNKKPDFLFPSDKDYHDATFSIDKLCTLAAKTTCKDRWRQILNEADRLRDENKYLCTMQQSISVSQMDEMQAEKVILVVPKPYIRTYPKERQDRIWTIGRFVNYVKELERN